MKLKPTVRQLFALFCCCSSPGFAQDSPAQNAFFGFEYILDPIAIKWACGGQRDADLSALQALVAQFPEDAANAGLPEFIDTYSALSQKNADFLEQVLGRAVTTQQGEQLCAAALPLSIGWLTPQQRETVSPSNMAEAETENWSTFFRVVEQLE